MRKNKQIQAEDAPLQRLLAGNAGRFDAYFSTRVLARIRALPQDEAWFFGLYLMFRRVAIAGTIAVGVLLAYNVAANWQSQRGGNALELALSIPPANVATSIQYLDFSQ